jgi:predicted ATP-dependent serine protease
VDSGIEHQQRCLEAFGGDSRAMARTYFETVADYVLQRKPDIVGHVDLLTKYDEQNGNLFLGDREYFAIAKEYLEKIIAADCIFEVNTGAMARGLRTSPYPSEELLSHRAKGASGSTVFCGVEGSRPLLCDGQALTSPTYFGTPRRTVNGADAGRVALLLAVLEKRASQRTYNQDVYVNVAGGLELSEPAADLALCVAVASSLKDRTLSPEVAVMGEVGLAGEVRTIPQCERRISECARLGFTTVIVPRSNARRIHAPEGVTLIGVDTVAQTLSVLF